MLKKEGEEEQDRRERRGNHSSKTAKDTCHLTSGRHPRGLQKSVKLRRGGRFGGKRLLRGKNGEKRESRTDIGHKDREKND